MGTTDSGLDLETKIFSTSGRGRTFFLTSLFIELNDQSFERIGYINFHCLVHQIGVCF
jgi:hypothetical protein